MNLVDRAASWDPVPDDRPCRVWLPTQHAPHSARPARHRLPQAVLLTLSPEQTRDVGPMVPRLLREHDVRTGDRVTVDLGSAASADLPGLALLLSVLWRRVGPNADLALSGGTPGLRAQLTSLGVTPAACRAIAYGGDHPRLPTGSAQDAPAQAQRDLDIPEPRLDSERVAQLETA